MIASILQIEIFECQTFSFIPSLSSYEPAEGYDNFPYQVSGKQLYKETINPQKNSNEYIKWTTTHDAIESSL